MAIVILCCSLVSGVNVQAKTDEWPKGPSKSSFVSGSASCCGSVYRHCIIWKEYT